MHALTREFPVVSLTMDQRLVGPAGVPDRLRFACHETEYRDAAERLRGQSRLSLDAPPAIDDIVDAYRAYATGQQEMGHPPAVDEMEDCVLVAAAARRSELVDQSLELARRLAGRWPEARLPLDWTGAEAWLENLESQREILLG